MGYLSKQIGRVRAFIKRAFAEQATPPKVGFAIALGVLVGTSPLVGFHSFVAIGLASVTRLNRMLTFLGTNISFGPLLGLFITGELVLGSRLLGRPSPSLSLEHAAQEATSAVGSWWLGWAIIGPATALLAGLTGFLMARAKLRREQVAGALAEASSSASSLPAFTTGGRARAHRLGPPRACITQYGDGDAAPSRLRWRAMRAGRSRERVGGSCCTC